MPILGLRGVGNIQDEERPRSWRQGILYWYPNGEAPLMALASMGKSEAVSDAEFNWFDKSMPVRRVFVNNASGYNTAATSIVVDDGAGGSAATWVKAGHVLMNERTFEHMRVTADPTGDALTVARGAGSTPPAPINNDDALLILSTVLEEGQSAGTAIHWDPVRRRNVTQIFNNTLFLTRRIMKTQLRTGDKYKDAKLDAYLQTMIDMEWAALFGEYLDEAGSTGARRRTLTGGMFYWVKTNVHNAGGPISYFELMDFFEEDFRYGSSEKLVLAGSTVINALNKLAKLEMTMNAVPNEESFGINVKRIESPFGDIILKNHPLLSDHPVFRGWAFGIDMQYFEIAYIDDLTFIPHIESPGSHVRMDEFYADLGFRVLVERTHFIWHNVTTAV